MKEKMLKRTEKKKSSPLDNNSTQNPKRELDRESRKKEKKNDAYRSKAH
jgi:hypothetical protein